MKVISAGYKHFCFGFTVFGRTYVPENYPAELILFQQALFPQQMNGDFREFSLSTILRPHHTNPEARLIQERRGFVIPGCE